MKAWEIVLAAALTAIVAATLLIIVTCSLFRHYQRACQPSISSNLHKNQSIISGTKSRSNSWKHHSQPHEVNLGCLDTIKDASDKSLNLIKHSNKMATGWRAAYPVKPFDWSKNQPLVAEAVEHGWATFAFTYNQLDSPIPPLKLWNFCKPGGSSCINSQVHFLQQAEPEISWEVGAGADYMQIIRLNPGLLPKEEGQISRLQALQSNLPLPGPPLGPLSFPQESYFEVTVVSHHNADGDARSHTSSYNDHQYSEHAKLISAARTSSSSRQNILIACPTQSLQNVAGPFQLVQQNEFGSQRSQLSAESERGACDEKACDEKSRDGLPQVERKENEDGVDDGVSIITSGSHESMSYGGRSASGVHDRQMDPMHKIWMGAVGSVCVMGVGLSAGNAPPFRLPGCDASSVGFLSPGRIFLNGIEQTRKNTSWQTRCWGGINSTVGCGFDPRKGKLYFTLNGELVDEMSLNELSEESALAWRHPLFPTIAANYDVTVAVNLGQAQFEYEPANLQRVADPCFRRPTPKSPATTSMIDSAELFSMGRINASWLNADVAAASPMVTPQRYFRGAANPVHILPRPHTPGSDLLENSDLFEIVLESRSVS